MANDSPGTVVSTRELRERGRSRFATARSARRGELVRVGYGLYGNGQPGVELAHASHLGVLSHTTAAGLHGLDLLTDPGLHVTSRHRRRSPPAGVAVHRGRLDPTDIVSRSGVSVTGPMRTVVDCCRVLPEHEAVVLADSAMREGLIAVSDLRAVAAIAAGPGSSAVRRVAARCDPTSESALESLLRLLFARHGLIPERQVEIRDRHGFVARVDFLFPAADVVVEADGFEFHADRVAFRADRRRQNALAAAGYTVLRFTWDDVLGRPDYVIGTVLAVLSWPR